MSSQALRSFRRDTGKLFRLRRFAGPAVHMGKLSHLRVAHLTDLHVGAITPMRIQHAAVDMTNRGNPDLVAITGDFICHSQRYLDALGEMVSRFNAPVVCVLGNHDHWAGAREVKRTLSRAGAIVLTNQHTVLTLRRQRVQVVGLDDAYTGHARLDAAVRGMRHDLPTIGLSHIAEEADRLWSHGVPLVLSGHTHAGQVTFARLHEFTIGRLAGHKYVHGLYGSRRSPTSRGAVYVGAGVGASVMPLRLGERAHREITFFELGVEPGSFEEPHSEQPALEGRAPTEAKREKRALAVLRKRNRRLRRRGIRVVSDLDRIS